MDIRSNEPYWLIKNSLGTSYPSLQENISSPVVIIGGGITGALIAYKLGNEGYKVVMVERRDVFNGSSAASTAMLQYEIDEPLHLLIEKVGITNAVSSYKNCEKAIFDLEKIVKSINSDCEFRKKKSVYFTSSKSDLDFIRKEFEARKEHGFDVELLENNQLQELGIQKGLLGIRSRSGAVMDPYELSKDLLNYCTDKGLRIFDRNEIVEFKSTEDGMELTTNSNFSIKTEHVIHCTGYESTKTLKEDVVKLKSTYAMASEAFKKIPPGFKDHIFWNTEEPYLYFRATADNRIIMGGGDENFKNAKGRDALLPKKEKALLKSFRKTFPEIDYIPDYSWAGTFGETKDGLPYLGKPDLQKNESYILGFGGNGITFSVMAMDCILPILKNEPHEFLEYYKFGR
ncbi:glycine/D-amino acid oxidase-like deaminating enzyme [Christiangramia gaetbulicola]|uniref:Glycine/D-amino acid oxidase-like deaminating enzyme n=1 Tax=Christiangramia gaetbulicola TaxID=703340 RepID=A0A2T6ACC3_9FLAO|nr:FAD-dependent oxidoreductase [Christiangramia gaetbulicola]PTX41457.1 glycine/D-amino acid oxidase-like deaminating enzyme [Christiangramia gaetbulicola]